MKQTFKFPGVEALFEKYLLAWPLSLERITFNCCYFYDGRSKERPDAHALLAAACHQLGCSARLASEYLGSGRVFQVCTHGRAVTFRCHEDRCGRSLQALIR